MQTLKPSMIFLLATTLLASACDPYVRTTAVDVRDPSLMHYATADGHSISGPSEPPTPIADHDVRIQGDHFAELIVTAHTTSSGALVTAWQTDPKTFSGERRAALGGAAEIELDDQAPLSISQQTLFFPVCGRYDYLGSGNRKIFGRASHEASGSTAFAIRIGASCDAAHDDKVVARTPESNVRSVRYESKTYVGRNILLAFATTVLTGAAGTTLLLARNHQDQPLSPALRGVGVGALAVGAGIDLAILIPTIFARDH